jgi:hypothetical protein
MLMRHENKKENPSFRTVLYADPESSGFNEVLDTGTSPV